MVLKKSLDYLVTECYFRLKKGKGLRTLFDESGQAVELLK